MSESDFTNELTLTWVIRPGRELEGAPAAFLELCREYLPAAVPIKFGTAEPLNQRVDEDNGEAFAQSWFDEQSTHWQAKKPFTWGNVGGFHDGAGLRDIVVRVDSVVLAELDGLRALRHLFVAVADRFGCFYADISVARQARRSKGGLYPSIENHALLRGREWRGLPIGDVWLAYFGREYCDLVGRHLELSETSLGAIHEFPSAWLGDERRDDATFVGVLPDELLAICVNMFGQPVGRDKISAGIGVEAAVTIPLASSRDRR